jgi:glycosyltransferase involved in cell wall biosynthesis
VYQIRDQLSRDSKIYIFTLSVNFSVRDPQTSVKIERLRERGIFVVNSNYKPFGLLMILRLAWITARLIFFCFTKRITVIHAWCTPAGAIGYILSLFTCISLIVDSFEPHAESMVESGTWKKNGIAFRLLFFLERLQLKRAAEVICATEEMINYSQKIYGVRKSRYFVKPTCVDLNLFDPSRFEKTDLNRMRNDVSCVYVGKFGGIYLEKEVFDFFKVAHTHWNGRFRVILLSNHSDEEIRSYCNASGYPYTAIEKKSVSHQEVPGYLASADFGICPVKPLPSKRFCTPIKNGEYWAMGLPVVITKDISVDSEIIEKNNIGYVLHELNGAEYLNAVKKIGTLIRQKELQQRIRTIARQNRDFKLSELVYKTIYALDSAY